VGAGPGSVPNNSKCRTRVCSKQQLVQQPGLFQTTVSAGPGLFQTTVSAGPGSVPNNSKCRTGSVPNNS
jgi:hypothetical protein